jgi:hypothetical protein
LIWAISQAPGFEYCHGEGNWILVAKILGADNERIGYRYARDEKESLKNDLIGIENRKTITVEVAVQSAATGKNIIGPQVIKEDVTYDYANQDSNRDLKVIYPDGKAMSTIGFSLGQLDTVGSAGEDAIYPIY